MAVSETGASSAWRDFHVNVMFETNCRDITCHSCPVCYGDQAGEQGHDQVLGPDGEQLQVHEGLRIMQGGPGVLVATVESSCSQGCRNSP